MDATTVVIVALSVAAGSVLKGVTGVGGPIIAVPVLAAVVGVERAVVVMSIPGLAMNLYLLWRFRRAAHETRDLPVLAVTGTVGVALGVWALASLDDRVLSALLAGAIILYLLVRLAKPTFEIPPTTSRVLSPVVGFGSGVMQGSTGISAPIVATYVHGFNLPRDGYVLAVSVLFAVFSMAQVAVIGSVGLYTPTLLAESLLACVPAVALLPVGDAIGRRLSAGSFNGIVLASLAALAGKLVFDVLQA